MEMGGECMERVHLKFLVPVLLLATISILSISSALIYTSPDLGNLALKQAIWYGVGFILVLVILKIKNDYIYGFTNFLYIIGILLLVGLLFFGTPINNSKCWYIIPGIGSFQPSEFMKVFLMLKLSAMLQKFREDYSKPTNLQEFLFLLKTLIVVFIPSILTFMQPDTGCVIIYLVIYIFIIFAAGIRLRWFIFTFSFAAIMIGTFIYLYQYKESTFIKIFGNSMFYRLERIFNWQEGSGLQLENALSSIGSAGFFGHGFNNVPIYFPEASTDFIFAVYASCFGLVGAGILIVILLYFDIQIILITKKNITNQSRYILAGILGMLVFQQLQNIGMTIGLLPITGITLPFVSYGGSSLLSYMLLIGLILNISTEHEKFHWS